MRLLVTTPRLVLRPFGPGDADLLVDLDADPAVTRFLTGGRPTPRAVVEAEVLPRFLAHVRDNPGSGPWVATEAATGEEAGWFSLRRGLDLPPGTAELGYRLRRAAWGRGLATEGALALVSLAFTRLGVEVVRAQTMTVNAASRRVLAKAGFSLVRTFFQEWPEIIEGSERGDVEYEITRTDWLSRNE